MTTTPPDVWSPLTALTPARIALGRAGASLPTREVLGFALAHARARDAVHAEFDSEGTARAIRAQGFETILVASAARDRATYLKRPDLGRTLDPLSHTRLATAACGPVDLAIVVADGLSATAVHAHAIPLLAALKSHLAHEGWHLAPVAVAPLARVALGDEIGETLRARVVAIIVGERPGLSAPDSLGVYLTFAPRRGRTDAERNCISNIRAAGLAPEHAAFKLAWLIRESLRRGATGVTLKDESDGLDRGQLT